MSAVTMAHDDAPTPHAVELEHLGPADHALIKGRQMFLDAVRAYQTTGEALGSHTDVSGVGKLGGGDRSATMAAE